MNKQHWLKVIAYEDIHITANRIIELYKIIEKLEKENKRLKKGIKK